MDNEVVYKKVDILQGKLLDIIDHLESVDNGQFEEILDLLQQANEMFNSWLYDNNTDI